MGIHERLRVFTCANESHLLALRKSSMVFGLLLTYTKTSKQTNNVRHPRSRSCNYHCHAPHTEGHLEPKKRNQKISTKFNLPLKCAGGLRSYPKLVKVNCICTGILVFP